MTILYGPNSFGKTSLFDAIDFAVTGGVGRLESRRTDVTRTLAHLDSPLSESCVTLAFRAGGAKHTVVGHVQDRTRAVLDGVSVDRKKVLAQLTAASGSDRVEKFVSLFRASHLFSQEQQELTRDFDDDCRLSAEIVSRMLAFEDYANANKKVAKVLELLREGIAETSEKVDVLLPRIEAAKRELTRLERSEQTAASTTALDGEYQALRAKLVDLGIDTESARPEVAVVRGWRATLESRQMQSRATSERLVALAARVEGIPLLQGRISSAQRLLQQKQDARLQLEGRLLTAEQGFAVEHQRYAELELRRSEAQERGERLNRIRAVQPMLLRLSKEVRNLAAMLDRSAQELAQAEAARDNAVLTLRAAESAASSAAAELEAGRAKLSKAAALEAELPNWERAHSRLAGAAAAQEEAWQALETSRLVIESLEKRLEVVTADQYRLEQRVTEGESKQSHLRRLLSELQSHIQTGVCPLCGDDHGSKDRLLESIGQLNVDPASQLRLELESVLTRTRELRERLTQARRTNDAIVARVGVARRDREESDAEVARIAAMGSDLGILLDTPKETGSDSCVSTRSLTLPSRSGPFLVSGEAAAHP